MSPCFGSWKKKKIFLGYIYLHNMAILVPTKGRNYWPMGDEFNNFRKRHHNHHYFAFRLSPTTVEKKKYKRKIKNMFTVLPIKGQIPWPMGHECHNFSRGLHGQYNNQPNFFSLSFVFVNEDFISYYRSPMGLRIWQGHIFHNLIYSLQRDVSAQIW